MVEAYVGEIRMFAGDSAPQGWMFCNGAELPISSFQELYTLIGTTYGGDGVRTFRIPDLQGRVPVHMSDLYMLGSMGGTENEVLTISQMPEHTHLALANRNSEDSKYTSPTNHYWGYSTLAHYQESEADVSMHPATIDTAGGDQSHTNMMPTMTTNFIIALYGIYPM